MRPLSTPEDSASDSCADRPNADRQANDLVRAAAPRCSTMIPTASAQCRNDPWRWYDYLILGLIIAAISAIAFVAGVRP